MRWFGIVYTPLMAVLGLLFIVLSFFADPEADDTALDPSAAMIAGSILAAGACVGGALRQAK